MTQQTGDNADAPDEMVELADEPTDAPVAIPEAESAEAAPDASQETPSSEPGAPALSFETPAATPAAPKPQAPDPALVARERAVREAEQALAQQQAMAEQSRQVAQVENDLRTRTTQLEATGLLAQDVEAIVERERGLQMQVLQARASAQEVSQVLRGQHAAALHYSQQYGIPFNDIATMATPQAMDAAGKAFVASKASTDEIAKLRAEMAEIKQSQVPADQIFDGAGGASPDGRGRASRMTYLTNKEGSLTDSEHSELGKLLGVG